MKKTSARKHSTAVSEMKSEYSFDYTKARPNPFASRMGPGSIAVVLDPDVATVFQSSESVNLLLRSVIAAVPKQAASRNGSRKRAL